MRTRLYLVVAYPEPRFGGAPSVAGDSHRAGGGRYRCIHVLGSVRAPRLAEARALGDGLARARGPHVPPAWAVRVRAAGGCPTGWLLEALARDGAAVDGAAG